MATKPERRWSWKGHITIVVALAALAGAVTGLVTTRVLDLGGNAGDLSFSHESLEGDFLTMLWLSAGAFTLVTTLLLAVGLRKGVAAAIPYLLGIAAIPATWVFLDKYF